MQPAKEARAEDKKSKEKEKKQPEEKESKKQLDPKSAAVSGTGEQPNAAGVSTQPERYWPVSRLFSRIVTVSVTEHLYSTYQESSLERWTRYVTSMYLEPRHH